MRFQSLCWKWRRVVLEGGGPPRVLGRTPSGVFILTCSDGAGHETGMLASWVQQASFDPPMLALAVEQYVGDWRLGYTFNRTDVDGERVNGHDAAIDRYYGERDVIGLRLTAGSEDVLQGTQVVASQVRALALQGRHGLSDAWALQWGLGYVRQGDFHDRRWLQLGLRRAF